MLSMSDEDREEYYRRRAIEIQRGIVTFKSCSTRVSEAYIWTYRTTTCDVVSVVTTAFPIKGGQMPDVNIEVMKKNVRYRQSKSKLEKLKDSPFQQVGFHVDKELERKKLNKLLLAERRDFMTKLNFSRNIRTKLENESAKKIQTIYRGYSTRKNMPNIVNSVLINKQIRSNIKSYLANRYKIILSMKGYKTQRMKIRNHSAAIIQAKFISYLSRKALRRKKFESLLKKKQFAATVIQCMVRGVHARERVKRIMERIKVLLHVKSVLKIQKCFRGLLGRRKMNRRRIKLRIVACRIIQFWYRAKFSKRMAAEIIKALHHTKKTLGAVKMQHCVRKFLARRRLHRLRLRRLRILIFKSVSKIQSIVRKFLARIFVSKKRSYVNYMREEKEALDKKNAIIEEKRKSDEENKALLDSVNIFLQASLNNTSEVEDIFQGLVSTDIHTSSDTNENGDTILTIAASNGNLDLVRKCLFWGFDVNHRNKNNRNALMLAVQNGHFLVSQYIASPPLSSEELSQISKLRPISKDDTGFLLVAAAANSDLNGTDILGFLLSLGLNVNEKNNETGMNAVLAACEIGQPEAFSLLFKSKADLTVIDNMGQTLLHKASGSSLQVVKLIMGLDPSVPIYMSDVDRVSSIVTRDNDGKDCFIHAALSGSNEILDLFEQTLADSPQKSKPTAPSISIKWSQTDIKKAIRLVETMNLFCLDKVISAGYGPSLRIEESGISSLIIACKLGDLDSLEMMMKFDCDFFAVDSEGRNAIHYASMCKTSDVIVHLLTHASASKFKVSQDALLIKDNNGNNAFHLAALAGVELQIDLLAAKAIEEGINVKNNDECTPLMIACRFYHIKVINNYLNMGADPKITDSKACDSLWHLFHPDLTVLAVRRIFCSEHKNAHTDDRNNFSTEEVSVVKSLIKSGCRLYSETNITQRIDEKIQSNKKQVNENINESGVDTSLEVGDVLILEECLTLIKGSLHLMSQLDCWRLFIGSIFYDTDGELRVFHRLLHWDIIDIIHSPSNSRRENSSITQPSSSYKISLAQINKLKDMHYLGLNIVGWLVKFNHLKGFQLFFQKGYDPLTSIDSEGSTCIHCIASFGTVDLLNILLADKRNRLEYLNNKNETAGMIAVKTGNFKVARRLFQARASPRRSLKGKYCAWVLAFARKYEKNEKNLQTNIIGDDDEKYFIVSPDPIYSTWYHD